MNKRAVHFAEGEMPARAVRVNRRGQFVSHLEVFGDFTIADDGYDGEVVEITADIEPTVEAIRPVVTTAAKLLGVTISDDVIRAALDAAQNH